jgi:hypothetical protein
MREEERELDLTTARMEIRIWVRLMVRTVVKTQMI